MSEQQQQQLIADSAADDSATMGQSIMNQMSQMMNSFNQRFQNMESTFKQEIQRTNGGIQQLASEFNEFKARSRPGSPVQQSNQTVQQQHTAPPASQYPIKMDISDQSSQESQHQTAAAHSTVQPVSLEDKRWRPEDIGYFDGTGNAQAFVDRIKSVSDHKGHRLVQANLVTLFKPDKD